MNKEEISTFTKEVEISRGFTPSGIDNNLTVFGGIKLFKKNKLVDVNPKNKLYLVIGNTGILRNTSDMVNKVQDLGKKNPKIFNQIIESIDIISQKVKEKLEQPNHLTKIGRLLNINHRLLKMLGISTPELSKLVIHARKNGALGAKLTGAGGGGSMFALCKDQKSQKKIALEIKKIGFEPFICNLSETGVILEN